MRRHTWLLSGVAVGAASMYFLDPDRGRRRRHIAADRARGAVGELEDLADKAERDLAHRTHGLAARARGAGAGARRHGRGLLGKETPEQRVAFTAVGGLLTLWGFVRGGLVGFGAALAGASLIANGVIRRQDGWIRVQKTITIGAPVEEVYKFWSNLDNLPRFMEHVLEVRTDGDRSHWRVAGPAGMPVEWDAEITERLENRKIAWHSLEGSSVDHRGEVHFERGDGATRISVHMDYHPPGGALGHVAAALLLGDPKTLMDSDLLRLKSLFEHGKARVHGEVRSRGDLPV